MLRSPFALAAATPRNVTKAWPHTSVPARSATEGLRGPFPVSLVSRTFGSQGAAGWGHVRRGLERRVVRAGGGDRERAASPAVDMRTRWAGKLRRAQWARTPTQVCNGQPPRVIDSGGATPLRACPDLVRRSAPHACPSPIA